MTFDIPFTKRNHYLMQKFLPSSCQVSTWTLPTFKMLWLLVICNPVSSCHSPASSSSLVPLGSFALSLRTSRSPTRNQNYASKSRGLGYNFIMVWVGETKAQKGKDLSAQNHKRISAMQRPKSRFLRIYTPLAHLCPGLPKLLDKRGT